MDDLDDLDDLLRDQLAYYRARAGEYDLVYQQRTDLPDAGELLAGLPAEGDVLELACGTGQWTRHLAGRAASLTAVDGSPEMLAIARKRIGRTAGKGPSVEFVEADLFDWRPSRRFDTVFFAFWLSHVPPKRFAEFWELVGAALRPGGRAVFVDNGPAEAELERVVAGEGVPSVRRALADGSEHQIVKVFYSPADLTAALAGIGWRAEVRPAGLRLISGTATQPVR
jgi:demethylmenaquinone methyltransferase/2-methoxy-6-polyprenyl-1,4-benzoquinol methylase